MVKRSAVRLCLLILSLLLLLGQAQASLVGETISGSISYEPPPPPYTWFDPDTGSAVVGGGIEFIYNDGWLNIPIDVGAWSVHIDVINISPNTGENANTPSAFFIDLSDLNFNDGSILSDVILTSVRPGNTEYPGGPWESVTPFSAEVTGDYSLRINFIGREGSDPNEELLLAWQRFGDSEGLAADVELVTSQVPLPGAVWLLGAGIFGLVGLRRKHRG